MTGRRQFLQWLGFSVVALAAPPVPRWLLERRDADRPELGLRLAVPEPWRFVAGAELDQIRAEARLPGGEAAKQQVIDMAGMPLLVAAREPHPVPGPTLVVWRQQAEQGDHASADNEGFAAIHEATYRRYGPWMNGFALERGGRADVFAGRPASSVVVRFRDESVRGHSWPVRLESHMLRWEHSWFTFNFLDLESGWGAAARADFAALERSVEFTPPECGGLTKR